MPDVEAIMEPWTDDRRPGGEMPDFENSDLITVVDGVCGECFSRRRVLCWTPSWVLEKKTVTNNILLRNTLARDAVYTIWKLYTLVGLTCLLCLFTVYYVKRRFERKTTVVTWADFLQKLGIVIFATYRSPQTVMNNGYVIEK